jgi:hypothetical protein
MGANQISRAWEATSVLTITEAACLIAGVDPLGWVNDIPNDAKAFETALARAYAEININLEPVGNPWVRTRDGAECLPYSITELTDGAWEPDAGLTKVTRKSVQAWCKANGLRFPGPQSEMPQHGKATYPEELRAAIEAFEAVHANPTLLRGRSPKTVLAEWLEQHQAGLSASARDRIATVANWQREGGAPKTPGK